MIKYLKEQFEFFRFHTLHRRSRRVIESWQLKRAAWMIAHARKNVPMYTELYGALPDTPLQSLGDLQAYPIVLKQYFLGRPAEEYTDTSDLHVGQWGSTSGTSGEPFTVLSNPHHKSPLPYRESALYRPIFWSPWWRYRPLAVARIMTKTDKRPYRSFVTVTAFLKKPVEELQRIAHSGAQVIETFPSVFQVIAETVRAHSIPLTVPYALSCGEHMTPAMRKYVSETLGCEIFNRYGMEEFKVIATECSEHDGMHVHCESLFVEVIDKAGRPVADGEPGRIIITDLYNRSMPLIRYDTGDFGKIVRSQCACGLRAPRVWLEGRYAAYLTFNRQRINHLEFDAALELFMHAVLRYIVVKESEDSVSVRVMPGPSFSDSVRERIVDNVSKLTGEAVRVRVECVDEITQTERGKSRIVLDLSSPAADTRSDQEPQFV